MILPWRKNPGKGNPSLSTNYGTYPGEEKKQKHFQVRFRINNLHFFFLSSHVYQISSLFLNPA